MCPHSGDLGLIEVAEDSTETLTMTRETYTLLVKMYKVM